MFSADFNKFCNLCRYTCMTNDNKISAVKYLSCTWNLRLWKLLVSFYSAKTTELVLAELLCCDCECVFCNPLVFYVSAFYFILWAVVSALLSSSYVERINDDDDDDDDDDMYIVQYQNILASISVFLVLIVHYVFVLITKLNALVKCLDFYYMYLTG